MAALTGAQVDEYLSQYISPFELNPVGDDTWSITVACKSLRGFDDKQNGHFWTTLLARVNKVLDRPMIRNALRCSARLLDRAEGGIELVARDEHVWADKRCSSLRFGIDETDPRILTYANVRPRGPLGPDFVIGNGGIVTFESRENVPKLFMLVLEYLFREHDDYYVAATKNFPDDDEYIYHYYQLWAA